MARFGREPGDRGTLRTRTTRRGVLQGFFVPTKTPEVGTQAAERLAAGVKLLDANPSKSILRIFPIDTRHWSGEFLGPKYSTILKIIVPFEVDEDMDLEDALEWLPSGLTKDFEYGLGLAQECDPIVNLIQATTDCHTIELVRWGPTRVHGQTFQLSFDRLDSLRSEFNKIKNRGEFGIRRVKDTFVHNDLARTLGLEPKSLSLGRLQTSKWMTKVAAGDQPLNEEEQDQLLSAATTNATTIAATDPAKLVRLQREIELVNLNQLIQAYEDALDATHNEDWWQKFFEGNIFVLQLIFGGPTVFIDSQVPIGEGNNSTKGKKIADYLLRNSMTNNACLVEIKRPSTQLMMKRPYREGLFGVDSQISQSVTQVLDQALQLTRHEPATKLRTSDSSWTSNSPRCFVVAGRATELHTSDRKKSFELYREHLSGVRLVTYDEILEQLKSLRDFLENRGV